MKIIELDILKLFEDISRDELISNLRKKQEKMYTDMILKKMHELVQQYGDRQSLSGYAFEISRYLGGALSPRELERMYRKEYMSESQMSTRKKIVENTDIIDNKKGWGAIPNNQEVDYLGLRVKMSPRTFINLAAPLDREPSDDIINHIKNGGKIGSPFLDIEIPENWENGDLSMPAKVVGHEGRNRMLAIAKAIGNNPIEVHLFFRHGLRNRHITDDFKKMLNRGLVKQRSKSIVKGPLFSLTESMLEWGRIVKGVNTTVDVGPNEIKRQAAKFGNTVDKDGRPPTMSKRVKGSSTNVLYNLGLAENYTPLQLAIMEGGHSLENAEPKQKKKTGILFDSLVELEENFLLLEKLLSTGVNLGDGFLLLSDHAYNRLKERLDERLLIDFKKMIVKFAQDPIVQEVRDMPPGDRHSEFCVYDERFLGAAIVKKERMIPNTKKFHNIYEITTVSPGLLFYSHQTLYKVPDEGPCRKFNQEDSEQLSNSQAKGVSRTGRFRT